MNGQGRALTTEEQHLQKLEVGISNFLATGNLVHATYVSLYREVYLLCRVLENELRSEDKLENVLDLLASNIKEYVKQNVQKRLSHLRDPIVLLKQYEKEWNSYSRQIQTINNIYSPLNGKPTDSKKRSVRSRLLQVWRDGVLNDNITQSLLDLLQRERNEEATDTNQISSTVQSLITLDQYIYENTDTKFPQNMYAAAHQTQNPGSPGKLDQTSALTHLPNYRQFFEDPFLEATRVYYSTEATNFLAQNPNIADYVKKVEVRLQQESIRGSMYLHKSTAQNLEQLCEKVLITTYQKEIQSGVRALLYRADPDQLSVELRGTYNLLNRVKGLHPLLIELEDFAVSEARGQLESLLSKTQQQQPSKPEAEPKGVDPKDYAEILINTYSRVRQLVSITFNNDPLFVAALDKACKKFVNTNPICTIPSKSPDLLARYTDSLLSKGTRNNYAEGERLLNEVFHVLRYLEEKDVFVHIASKCCARRFIYDTFDPDLMGLAISKLKEVFGIEYTGKLQRMFTDIQLNRDLKDKFRDWCSGFASSAGEVINALVLTSGSWPLSLPSTEGGFHAPAEILNLQNTFTAWYLGAFSGRKLLWLPQHSRSSVQYRLSSKTYTLQLGDDYLLACLLLFNDVDSLTVEEVMAATSLSGPAVASVIRALQKTKILDHPLLPPDVESPDRGFVISLNKKFVSKNLRITIHRPPPVVSSSSSSRPMTDPEIDQERKIKIQAALVRVMKARKVLSHAELVTEVQLQLSRYFNPKPSIVKQGIECVIENGYLERDPQNKDKYLYKA